MPGRERGLPVRGLTSPETFMSTRQPARKNPDRTTEDEVGGRASTGAEGGAPAAEEDIGTEGAGTEPRDTIDAERDKHTDRRD